MEAVEIVEAIGTALDCDVEMDCLAEDLRGVVGSGREEDVSASEVVEFAAT